MNVFFKPWVGPDYAKSDRKILVIGDSHYCGSCDRCGVRGNCSFEEMAECNNFTISTISDYIKFRAGGEKANWMTKTYCRFDKLYYGKEEVSEEESVTLWNRIAFYNFLQTAASDDASNTNYTNDDYAASSPMATEVINELRPDVVIVWGSRAWGAMTGEGWHDGANSYTGYYTLADGHVVHCIKIIHPSRIGLDEWIPKLDEFLKGLE